MTRLRLPLSHPSFLHAASAVAALQLFGCTTPNDDSTEVTSSTSSTSASTSTSATSSTATSSSVGTGSGGGDGGSAPSSTIFVERFEIANASTGKGGGPTAPDYSTKIVASAIQADGAASAGCIDVRSVGLAGAGSTIVSESVVAVLSAPLSDASHQAIATQICSLTPSGCTVTSMVASQTLAESAIEQPIFGDDGFQIDSLYFSLDGHGAVPRMSNACASGLYVDSWNHAGETPEAKAYLTAIGVDLASGPVQLQLDRKVGEDYEYVFGFGTIAP
jgi:hypothetical protein